MHWAIKYIGKPYERGSQGPDTFDCWSLIRHVLKVHYGIDTPIVDIPEDANKVEVVKAFMGHEELVNWVRIPQAEAVDGDCVELAHAKYPRHVGIWLCIPGQKPGLLHTMVSSGVVFSYPEHLRSQGWGKLEFYRHVSRIAARTV